MQRHSHPVLSLPLSVRISTSAFSLRSTPAQGQDLSEGCGIEASIFLLETFSFLLTSDTRTSVSGLKDDNGIGASWAESRMLRVFN